MMQLINRVDETSGNNAADSQACWYEAIAISEVANAASSRLSRVLSRVSDGLQEVTLHFALA